MIWTLYLLIGYIWAIGVVFFDYETGTRFEEPLSLFDIAWFSIQVLFWPIGVITFVGHKTGKF